MKLWLKIAIKVCCISPLLASTPVNQKIIKLIPPAITEIKAPPAAYRPEPGRRIIYLTWDDAPQAQGTINCIRCFYDNGVKATFFAVGLNIHDDLGRSLLDTIQNAYPELLLANHSWSHAFRNHYKKYYSAPDSAVDDILYNDSCLHFRDKIVRLPSSNSWVSPHENKGPASASMVRNKLSGIGYSAIGWDVEWRSTEGRNAQGAEEMVREVNRKLDEKITNTPNTIVILSHDRYFKDAREVDSLNKFISLLKADPRNVFETIDHYPL